LRPQRKLQHPAQSVGSIRRDPAGLSRRDGAPARRLQIGDRHQQAARIVVELAEAGIALGAQKTAYPFACMAMIDPEPTTFGLLSADRTDAALARQQCVIVVAGEPVHATGTVAMMPFPEFGIGPASVPRKRIELVLAGVPIRAVSFGGFLSIFRIVPPLLTLTRVDLIPVCFPIRAGSFYNFLAISRIFRISLLLPNGLEGSHRCVPP
jgi:hypothetical protein